MERILFRNLIKVKNDMKKTLFFLFLACLAVTSQAQDIYATLKFTEYPIELRYPNDYQVQHPAKMSYIVTNGVTEMYIKGYKLSNRFTADSLQRMFEKDIYNDDNIVNLQMREKGRGSLGSIPADRLVLEFLDKDKLYKVLAFMVYFHINQEYNAILFFYDMPVVETNSYKVSYDDYLVNMGQTLKWSENIPYKTYTDTETGLSVEMPSFWRSQSVTQDSLQGFLIDDDRGRFWVEMKYTKDSSTADKAALKERDALKAKPGKYTDQKFKASSEKSATKEVIGQLTGLYQDDVNGLKRPTLFKRMYYKRVVDGKLVEYTITLESPEGAAEYYAPIHMRMLEKLKLPGVPYEVPKPPKK